MRNHNITKARSKVRFEENKKSFKKLGAKPSKKDERDYQAKIGIRFGIPGLKKAMYDFAPAVFSNRSFFLNRILDQGNEGSCVAHAASQHFTLLTYKETKKIVEYSERWLMIIGQYYDSWAETSSKGEDGTEPRAVLKGANKLGLLYDVDMPYVAGKRTIEWDDDLVIKDMESARKIRVDEYVSCFDGNKLNDSMIKQMVMKSGSVIVCVEIPEPFYSMDTKNDRVKEGTLGVGSHAYHALLIVGWNQTDWEILNSWGKSWGNGGFCLWERNSFAKHCYDARAATGMRYN